MPTLIKKFFMRNAWHTVTEAVNRQLAHYPYHIGQMVSIAKMACNLPLDVSIDPKGNSKEYSARHFDN
jgi:hypothetical protein